MFVKSVTMRTPLSGNIYKKSEAITVTKNFCETLTKISLSFSRLYFSFQLYDCNVSNCDFLYIYLA